MNGNNGHSPNDIIAFPGSVAQTVEKQADWVAKSFRELTSSIRRVGERLVKSGSRDGKLGVAVRLRIT